MKYLILSLFLCLIVVSVHAQTKYVTVIAINANLRGSPSTSGNIVGAVRKGETFKLIEERGAWYLVETPNYVGWLHGSTIKLASDPNVTTENNTVSTSSPESGVETRFRL